MERMQLMRPEQISKTELYDLCNFCGLDKNSTMVEIGSYAGESAAVFAKIVGKIYCVDPWVPGSFIAITEAERVFDNVALKYPNIVKCKQTSVEFAESIHNCSLDFVYIDGIHTEEAVEEDIITWIPKIKQGHYIGGHDYREELFPEVVATVDRVLGKPDKIFDYYSYVKKL